MITTTVALADQRFVAVSVQSTSGWVVLGVFILMVLVGLMVLSTYRRQKRDGR